VTIYYENDNARAVDTGLCLAGKGIRRRMGLSDFLLVQTLNGLSFAALLFLLSSGLSLIYGVMKIVNIAHGSFFMVGAYVGLSVILKTGNFFLGALAGGLAVGALGFVMERGFCGGSRSRPSPR